MATVTQKHRPEAKRSPYKLDVPKEVNFLDCFCLQSEIHRNLIVLFVFYLHPDAPELDRRMVPRHLHAWPCVTFFGEYRVLVGSVTSGN